ncbi:hypothetical protein [Granulicella sp. dw_53]|uniref:hypothetical protein n=1 Tax=Granulicella sp. dw_53 TaxID=2719792 RepID=UPI001BD5F129|nr:hypothetical protein [Granulicella sp. dw_53]
MPIHTTVIRRTMLVLPLLCFHLALAATSTSNKVGARSMGAKRYIPKLSDFRLEGDQIIPEIDSSNNLVFSGSISAIPGGLGVDRFTAPPLTVVMQQKIGVIDEKTGAAIVDGEPSNGFRKTAKERSVWEPGSWTTYTQGWPFSLRTKITALSRYQGYIVSVAVINHSKRTGHFGIGSIQQPSIASPREWNWNAAFQRNIDTPVTTRDGDIVVHQNSGGAVAIALRDASIRTFSSLAAAKAAFTPSGAGNQEKPDASSIASLVSTRLTAGPGAEAIASIVVSTASDGAKALQEANELVANPAAKISQTHNDAQISLERWFQRLPAVASSSPQLLKFYRHAAAQLLFDRWRVGKAFHLDPWYPTSGLDSGAMNTYAWDIQYSALAFSLLDPPSLRRLLIALPAAPLTEHFSIEPIMGKGIGTYYAYNSYAYINSVDQYLSITGDRTLLQEQVQGKTVLEWMIALAEWGEKEKDPDGNNLLDYGEDKNLLELKKTKGGPGYSNEVPSPNGERVYTYQTVADLMEQVDSERYSNKISHFRAMAKKVTEAINNILWLEKEGWYGTRQRDGSVVPVYSIQIFDLLRIPGLVPADRAKRLIAHLKDDEFVAPWGIRSMSVKDRLFDYNDHDWAGAMSYAGDGPQLSADLFTSGFLSEGWLALEKIFWWPDHMAVYPQGIANDSYTSRFPAAAPFGGRITAGRANIVAGAAGVETVLRGLFGLELGRDGSIGFSNNRPPALKNLELSFPYSERVWTVRPASDGLHVSSSDGFESAFLRDGGSMLIKLQGASIDVWLRSRSDGSGHLTLNLHGIEQLLHVHESAQLVFRRNGILLQPELSRKEVTLDTRTSPNEEEHLEIRAIRATN